MNRKPRNNSWSWWLPSLLMAGCSFGPAFPVYTPPALFPRLAKEHQPEFPNPLPVAAYPPDYVWDNVVDAIDDYFTVDREESIQVVGDVVTAGRLETLPAVGSTVFEPWRHDSSNAYQKLESTFQSIRRRARAEVTPVAGGYLVTVNVYKDLENVRTPEQSTASSANFLHSTALQRFESPGAGSADSLGWIPQGRDSCLEQQILCNIANRLTPDQGGQH